MKKIVSVLISVVMCIGLLVGCGSSNGGQILRENIRLQFLMLIWEMIGVS